MTEVILDFISSMGIVNMDWRQLVMILVSCVLLYLAIAKGFEPLLLIPIGFGMLLSNLPLAGAFDEAISSITVLEAGKESILAHVETSKTAGLLKYLFMGDELGIFPPLIFLGVGAMTDFGPLISNPKSILLGAAAQFGIFFTFVGAILLGFTGPEASSIGIIGGADGPTAIYTATKLAPHLLAPIAVAAYSYMALVPIIQPPIMKALTTKEERAIVMTQSKPVSKKVKIIFPIVVTIVVSLILPSAATLIGMLMFGNLLKECMVADRLVDTATNSMMNIVTILLGLSVGASAEAEIFLSVETLKIFLLGVIAFGVGTATGVIFGKIMNKLSKEPINPLIGGAGVSAVPMASRVAHKVAQEENPSNFLLMHAMGPNVAGVIGSAVAAGILLSLFG
ncbi:sodium ion-translocating decarboxylase subunit beta [Intestinibacter sp.]